MTHSLHYSQYDLPLLFEEQVKYMKVKNILFFAQDLDFKKVFFKFAYLCLHFFFEKHFSLFKLYRRTR